MWQLFDVLPNINSVLQARVKEQEWGGNISKTDVPTKVKHGSNCCTLKIWNKNFAVKRNKGI